MGKRQTFSNRLWNGESLSLFVIATGRAFEVRRKFDRYHCVRGFAVFEDGRRKSPYRILSRDVLENWLDTGELREVDGR